MAIQLSVAIRNARLDTIESTTGTAPTLTIRTGAQPADCATANAGTVLATMTLPSDWMAAASGGTKSKSGTWQDATADASGTAAHFRIHNSTACIMQGNVSLTSGGGDIELDNTNVASGQQITITTFDLTDANA